MIFRIFLIGLFELHFSPSSTKATSTGTPVGDLRLTDGDMVHPHAVSGKGNRGKQAQQQQQQQQQAVAAAAEGGGKETATKKVSPHREPDEDEHAAVEALASRFQEAKQAITRVQRKAVSSTDEALLQELMAMPN